MAAQRERRAHPPCALLSLCHGRPVQSDIGVIPPASIEKPDYLVQSELLIGFFPELEQVAILPQVDQSDGLCR